MVQAKGLFLFAGLASGVDLLLQPLPGLVLIHLFPEYTRREEVEIKY